MLDGETNRGDGFGQAKIPSRATASPYSQQLSATAYRHSAWRLLSKSIAGLLWYRSVKENSKATTISALCHWRKQLLSRSLARLQQHVSTAEARARALQLYKQQALRKGLNRLKDFRRPEEDFETKVAVLLLWKKIHTLKVVTGLARNVLRKRWDEDAKMRAEERSWGWKLRTGILALRGNVSKRRWLEELSRRANEFRTLITPVHAMGRVFERLKRRKEERIRRKHNALLADSKRFQFAFQTILRSIREAVFEERQRNWFRLESKAIDALRRKVVSAKKSRLAYVFSTHRNNRMTERCVTNWRKFNEIRRAHRKAFGEVGEKRAVRLLETHFRKWHFSYLSIKDAESYRNQQVSALQKRITYRPFALWTAYLHRKRLKSYSAVLYANSLKRRLFAFLRQNHKAKLRLLSISAEIVHICVTNTVADFLYRWRSAHELLQSDLRKIRFAQSHYRRRLSRLTLAAFLIAVRKDMLRVRSIAPKRRFLLKKCVLSLWRKAKDRQISLNANCKRCRFHHKLAILQSYLSFWTTRAADKSLFRLSLLRKVQSAQRKLSHFSLMPCFGSWVDYHHSVSIKRMKNIRSYQHYRSRRGKEAITEWIAATHIGRIKRFQRMNAVRHYATRSKTKLFGMLTENWTNGLICRRILRLAVSFHLKRLKNSLFYGLKVNLRRRKLKKSQEKAALRLRQSDLVSEAFQTIARVGFQWRDQRLALTSLSKERKAAKIWTIVAKCAKKWKDRALASHKPNLFRSGPPPPKEELTRLSSSRVTPRRAPVLIAEEKPTSSKRPPPRRHSNVPASPRLKDDRVPEQRQGKTGMDGGRPIEERLSEIQAELLEYKIEKEALAKLCQTANAEGEIRQVAILKAKCDRNVPRIKALYTEIAALKSLTPS